MVGLTLMAYVFACTSVQVVSFEFVGGLSFGGTQLIWLSATTVTLLHTSSPM